MNFGRFSLLPPPTLSLSVLFCVVLLLLRTMLLLSYYQVLLYNNKVSTYKRKVTFYNTYYATTVRTISIVFFLSQR